MFDLSVITENQQFWLTGFFYTCWLTLVSCFIGTILAIILAIAWRSEEPFVRGIVIAIVEVFKGVPLLVLLVAIQYVVPTLWKGWNLSSFSNSVIALSLSLAVFLAEVLRSGIEAIPKEHIEAAEALGLNRWRVIQRVTLPETIRRTFASVVVLYLTTLKFSTLASVIGVAELLFTARMINIQTVRPLEVYATLTLVFVALVVPLSFGSRYLEKTKWLALTPTNEKKRKAFWRRAP